MTQLYMLDTNTVSYILNGRSAAARSKFHRLKINQVVCISAITEAELWYGLAKNAGASRLRPALEWFLGRIQILGWGREEAHSYGELRAKQERAGKTLESMDLLIAAHAIAVGAVLVTRDKAFHQVQEITKIENWANDV